MTHDDVIAEFRNVKADYTFNADVMCEDDERVRRVKEIITKDLDTIDRTIIILYAEMQSYRELGKALGVSHTTARKEVLRIRRQILNIYEGR